MVKENRENFGGGGRGERLTGVRVTGGKQKESKHAIGIDQNNFTDVREGTGGQGTR